MIIYVKLSTPLRVICLRQVNLTDIPLISSTSFLFLHLDLSEPNWSYSPIFRLFPFLSIYIKVNQTFHIESKSISSP